MRGGGGFFIFIILVSPYDSKRGFGSLCSGRSAPAARVPRKNDDGKKERLNIYFFVFRRQTTTHRLTTVQLIYLCRKLRNIFVRKCRDS